MISSIEMELGESKAVGLNYNMSSLLHGYIMENVSAEFAQEMHKSELRPFSQSLRRTREGKWIWRVNGLTDSACNNIINMLTSKESIYLSYKEAELDILGYSLQRTDYNKLFENNYMNERVSRYISLSFISPTAFKSNGSYINYPNLRLLFMSLINKYDKNSDSTRIYDEHLLEELDKGAEIAKYNLRSTYFSLEGVRIPSFTGDITIRVNCGTTTVRLVNMLLEFAQYSGVGIKNALGMGGVIKREDRRGNNGKE